MSDRPELNTVPVLVAVVLVAVGALFVAPTVTDDPRETPSKSADDVRLVEPGSNESGQLWPFTSRRKEFESLTLPINLVFQTDASTTRYLLTSEGNENWENHTEQYRGNFTIRLGVPGPPRTNATDTPTAKGTNTTSTANETNTTSTANGTNATVVSNQSNVTSTTNETTATAGGNQPNTSVGTGESNVSAGANATGASTATATVSPTTTESGPAIVINGTEFGWRRTHGGTRYTFVRVDGRGRWLDETYQLHNGDYFGSRTHLRLYEGGPEGEKWTAIQAHHEHWDWFGLRHSVGSLSTPQHRLERSFYGKWYVVDITRKRYANGGASDYDGWVSVVNFRNNVIVPPRLFLFPFIFGLAVSGRAALASVEQDLQRLWEGEHITRFHATLFLAVAALPLVVRMGAIATEQTFPDASPFLVGAPFYALLVLGLPIAAGVLSRPLDPVDAFVLTVVAVGTGILADYAYIGVTLLEFGVVLHRITVLVTLGVIAAAAAAEASDDWRRSLLAIGLFAWVAVVVGPVLGLG